jgi:multidrug efflux system outer membrane protein
MKTRLVPTLSAFTAIAVLSLSVSAPLPAYAVFEPAKPAPKPANGVTINPASLRAKLIQGNFGVAEQYNLVKQAKDSVDQARGALLPKLNIGAIISGAVSGTFGLSAISFLLPFLLPSNWANLHQSEDLLQSQKIGFRLVQLNNYASAYGLYQQILADMAAREVVVTQYNDYVFVRDYIKSQIGSNQADIDAADGKVESAAGQISATDEILLRERESLRQMLALDLNANITVDAVHPPASPAETIPLNTLVSKVQSVSPENAQYAWMIKAAQEARWSKVFGFLGGASVSIGVDKGIVDWGNVSGNGSLSIGFDYVPSLNLASDQIANVQIHQKEELSILAQIAATTQGSLEKAQDQLMHYTNSVNDNVRVAQDAFQEYRLGHKTLNDVFLADENVASSTAFQLKAQADIDQLRVTLHRELLTDQFSNIKGCAIKAAAEAADHKYMSIIPLFRSKNFSISIDEACAAAN